MDDLHVRHRNAMPPRLISGRPSDGNRDLFSYRVRAPARELLRAIDALA